MAGGANTARRLAEHGFTVYAGARNARALPTSLRKTPATASLDIRAIQIDVTDDDSVAAAARSITEERDSLDVLVNNAGIPGTWAGPDEVGSEDFVDVFETNVFAPVRVTRAFLPLLRRGTHPRLVMVSSGMGSLALQSTDEVYRPIAHLPYPASKAAQPPSAFAT